MNSLDNLESWSEALSESPLGSVLAKDLHLCFFFFLSCLGDGLLLVVCLFHGVSSL